MQTIATSQTLSGIHPTLNTSSVPVLWTGRVLSSIAVAFMFVDSVGKLLRLPPVIEATAQLGYPAASVVPIGVILLCCTAAYAIPRTSVLGAVLTTAYLGGAVASQLRAGNPLLTHVLFPTYVAALVWGGLILRDAELRAFVVRRIGRAR